MIDNTQQIDRAEHDAVLAEQTAERASEQQHLDLVAQTVADLLAFGRDAYTSAQAALDSLTDEVTNRRAPNVHRYELLARWQHVSLLAPSVANAIEETQSYDLDTVASGVVEVYRAQHFHASRPAGDCLNRALVFAADRVIEQVARTAQYAAEAVAQQSIEAHERDLAARDAL